MFVLHNVGILYDVGYIFTARDLQCLTIDKTTIKTLRYGFGIHFTLCCVETWLVVSSTKHPPCFYRLEKQSPSLFNAWKSKGWERLVFAYAGNGCLSWEFNPGLLSPHH